MITEPIALDKSLNTTDQNSQNLADVMKEGLAGIRNAIGSGNGHTIVDPEGNEMSPEGKLQFTGGVTVTDNPNDGKTVVNISGGHTIIDQSGQTMPTKSKMQFADSFVSDDDVNGKTVIENIKEHSTKADYDNATEDGFHVIDDGEDAVIHPSSDDYVEVTADGVKTRGVLLNELFALIDSSKVTDSSMLDIGGAVFQISIIVNSEYRFGSLGVDLNSNTFLTTAIVNASNSKCERITIDSNASAQYRDLTTNKPSNGTKITLYYGNKKAVVDLQTTANRCLMPDGETTVASALTVKTLNINESITDGVYLSPLKGGEVIIMTSRILGVVGSSNHLFMPIWATSSNGYMVANFYDFNTGQMITSSTTISGTISYIKLA
jgi:hypothetical protein